MTTLAELRDNLGGPSAEYIAKQMHRVPDFPVVVRESFILERVVGKVVLDIGASGKMHEAIVDVAKKCYGIDREDGDGVTGMNLDDLGTVSHYFDFWNAMGIVKPSPSLIVCGEVIEHLANPGTFLAWLREQWQGVTVIFTVPNAASHILQSTLRRGVECVNNDHVAWYSWKTLSVLLGRYGYQPQQWAWYGPGKPGFNEGIICVAE